MYPETFKKSIEAVERERKKNIAYEPERMTAKEKEELLAAYHPDYKASEFSELQFGPNKGEKVPHELCAMLQAHSRIRPEDIDLSKIDYDVDVLIIGGWCGGLGADRGRRSRRKSDDRHQAAYWGCQYHDGGGRHTGSR